MANRAVPPEPDDHVADINAPLEQNIFDLAEQQWGDDRYRIKPFFGRAASIACVSEGFEKSSRS